jgi:ATP-dependent DNA helicase RecG
VKPDAVPGGSGCPAPEGATAGIVSFSLLDRPVQFLKGVGPVRAAALAGMGILTARDLLYMVPRRYDDASTIHPVRSIEVGMEANAIGRITSKGVIPTRKGLRIFQAVLQDETGMITCSWPGQPWLDKKLQKGDLVLVSGPVRHFHGRQIQPREVTVLARASDDEDAASKGGRIFVSYPGSDELPQWVVRRIFRLNLDALLERIGEEEYLGDREREELGLLELSEALGALHRPQSLTGAEEGRRRLAYDELFFMQIVQAQVRHRQTAQRSGIRFVRTNDLIRPMHEALPFELTVAQARVLREIYADMTSERRMNRLLQGDVGSGKTVVALFSMLLAAESGYQSALMAPTEILAEQHASRLRASLEMVGLGSDLLTGRMPAAERRDVLGRIAAGKARVIVGTHALIQESVSFANLGLVVVDEQHRFGVRQRMALGDQGEVPDTLVMSATPIPRSLAMALYGDLDLSILDELPPGRKAVDTHLRFSKDRDEVYALVRSQLALGRQAYVVLPLVAESEKMDLRSATTEHARLQRDVFPEWNVGLLHGQLGSDEKYDVMHAFLEGEIDVLVATTVIEVGIDVENASVMVVEHAERFGLSQLHQLRGRVGRGAAQSTCILLAEPGELALERLKVLRRTHDGFEVAKEDLRIRGQGDFLGSRQHGRDPLLRFADLSRDEALLREAQRRARVLIDRDPDLESAENRTVRVLLDTRHAEKLRLGEVG